ncbi:hypothetical protein [Radiobacillus sp. PE A8.2]
MAEYLRENPSSENEVVSYLDNYYTQLYELIFSTRTVPGTVR